MVSPFCPFIRAAKSLPGHRTLSISLFLSVLPLTTWGQDDGREESTHSFFPSKRPKEQKKKRTGESREENQRKRLASRKGRKKEDTQFSFIGEVGAALSLKINV